MNVNENKVIIKYCTQCRWLMRAGWMAQELLTTFENELDEVSLKPGHDGIFIIEVNGIRIFNRAESKRFPQLKETKQKIRDLICPEKKLGHSDK